MILSDREIKRRIEASELVISSKDGQNPLENLGPASLDFRLGNSFKIYKRKNAAFIDIKKGVQDDIVKSYHIETGEPFVLHPGDFVLGVTMEKIKIPYDLVARCEGRSSIGRLGIIIHSTAGFIDPGFEGTITLEMTNINELPIIIYPGMRIGQFAFETILGEVINTYDKRKGSKYMNQEMAEHSRVCEDLENKKDS